MYTTVRIAMKEGALVVMMESSQKMEDVKNDLTITILY